MKTRKIKISKGYDLLSLSLSLSLSHTLTIQEKKHATLMT
jgi:hypothetical protein